jgi:hypothetical protein
MNNASRLALETRTRPIVSRLNISAGSSELNVIENFYDIYVISNSGPLRDAYDHFKEDIIQAFYDGIKHRPETTFGNVKADVLAETFGSGL